MSERFELSLQDVVEAHAGLGRLVERYKEELGIGASVRVARMMRQLRPEVELYNQKRDELVVRHGREEDGRIVIPAGSRKLVAFNQDERELGAQVAKLPIEPLKVAELGLEQVDADIVLMILPVVEEG